MYDFIAILVELDITQYRYPAQQVMSGRGTELKNDGALIQHKMTVN